MEAIRRFWRETAALQMPLYAANACYFLMLSLFPGLLLVLALLYWAGLNANDLILLLEDLLPGALLPWAEGLIVSTYYNASAAALSVSALVAVWSASRGIYGLMAGLNRVYAVAWERHWLRQYLVRLACLGLFLGVLLATLVLHVLGRSLLALLSASRRPLTRWMLGLVDWRMLLLLLLQSLVFCLMYGAVPGQARRLWKNLPGAVLVALGWQGFSRVFSLYVHSSRGYTAVYGSVYAMALGMLWLYCCVRILLLGGAINRFLQENYPDLNLSHK